MPHSHAAAARAVELARNGEVEALMKGALHTDELMQAVVDRSSGLRTERRISHVFALDVPSYPKPLMITDAAINIAPDLDDQARHRAERHRPGARARHRPAQGGAAVGSGNRVLRRSPPRSRPRRCARWPTAGQIIGGILDGPLAFDNAISRQAAAAKHIDSPVAGDADILVVPDLEAGNMLAKQLIYLAGAEAAGIALGARVPIMLTSRADGMLARLASAALALLYSHHRAPRSR